jgi:hypothetical protein
MMERDRDEESRNFEGAIQVLGCARRALRFTSN